MHKQLTHKQVIGYLNMYYGINVNELMLLPLGADINASIYKAKTWDKFYFVKLIYGHEHDAGLAVLELLQQAKVGLIIPPVLTIQGQLLQRIDNASLMVQPFIDGQNCFSHSLTDDQWIALGKSLKSIHEMDVPPSIQIQLRKENFSPQWRTQVKSFYHLFEDNSAVDIFDEISQNLLIFIKIHAAEIYRLVNRAEELAKECQVDSSSFVLCHADLHGGNVLVDNNALYIVDWDNPMLAPIERDLMFMGGGVGNVWNKQNEVELFYKGYGEVKIDMNLLAYYRHERIVEDIAIYIQQILYGDKNRLEMYQHFIDMFDRRGVVELAFETDII
jgi:spectinomycin phosphotransferase